MTGVQTCALPIFILEEAHFKIIAEWEHYAVLTLLDTSYAISTASDVCNHFNITLKRAEEVLHNLEKAGFIEKLENVYRLTKGNVQTTEDISSRALVQSHTETLEIGVKKLHEVALELRDFSSLTIAMDMAQIQEAKLIIREFRKKMGALLKSGRRKTAVYQLAIQFYPLTVNQGEVR